MGVLIVIGTVLAFLRFTDYIDWAWWVVLLPFIVAAVLGFMTMIMSAIEDDDIGV